MDANQRRLADFFARLASLPTTAELLTEEEQKALFTRPHGVFTDFPLALLKPAQRRSLESTFRALSADRGERAFWIDVELGPACRFASFKTYYGIGDLHWVVRRALHGLLSGKEVSIDQLTTGISLRLEGDRLVERSERSTSTGWLMTDLLALLRLQPFPFRSCPACSRVFVRVRRQIYCSRRCGAEVTEAGRKESKRVYMRQYMAARRARKRKRDDR